MQVYLSEHIAPSAYARLARHFEIVDNFDHPEQLAAMIIRRAVVPRAVIARAPNLKVIAMHGVSRDTIDTAAAAEYGVPVPTRPSVRPVISWHTNSSAPKWSKRPAHRPLLTNFS